MNEEKAAVNKGETETGGGKGAEQPVTDANDRLAAELQELNDKYLEPLSHGPECQPQGAGGLPLALSDINLYLSRQMWFFRHMRSGFLPPALY